MAPVNRATRPQPAPLPSANSAHAEKVKVLLAKAQGWIGFHEKGENVNPFINGQPGSAAFVSTMLKQAAIPGDIGGKIDAAPRSSVSNDTSGGGSSVGATAAAGSGGGGSGSSRGAFGCPPSLRGSLSAVLDATSFAMLLDGMDLSHVRRPKKWRAPEEGASQNSGSLVIPSQWQPSPRLRRTTASGASALRNSRENSVTSRNSSRNSSATSSDGAARSSPGLRTSSAPRRNPPPTRR